MSQSFRPDNTVAELLKKDDQSNAPVSVAGRALSPTEEGFLLVDGGAHLTVNLTPGKGEPPKEASWVGVEGYWNQAESSIQDAHIVFLKESCRSIAEAAARGLPEAHFVTNPSRLAAVQIRAQLLNWVRAFLEDRGFVAVQTPMLHAEAEVAYLQQYETLSINDQTLYLRTDPEEYLKRYLTAGLEAVYEISTNVRGEWPDANHLQEFTSVECYRRFWSFDDALSTSCELVAGALNALRGETVTTLHGRPVDLTPPLSVRSFAELVREHTGLELDQYSNTEALAEAIRSRGWWQGTGGPLDQFRRTWLEWLLDHRIFLELGQPTFVIDFPVELGLSYRERPEQPGVCARGELLLPGGFELVHLYENLTDPDVLRARYEVRLKYRIAAGLPTVTLNEGLFESAALGMPPMAGIAVGLDRLLLLVLGKGVVGDGLLFPQEGFP